MAKSLEDVLSALTHLIERPPRVKSYVLAFSTGQGLALGQTPLQSPNITPIPGVGG